MNRIQLTNCLKLISQEKEDGWSSESVEDESFIVLVPKHSRWLHTITKEDSIKILTNFSLKNGHLWMDANKCLLTEACYSCHQRGSTSAWQIQRWILTAYHWTEHRVSNEGARERTQGAEGVSTPIGGTTIWTNQYPPELPRTKSPTKEYKWWDSWLQLHM